MAIYTSPLPYPNLLSASITKQVKFSNAVCNFRHRVSQAVSMGKPLCFETYNLMYPSLTDAELALVEQTFNIQETDFRIAWVPPTEDFPRNFRPPLTWKKKRFRLEAPRGGGCAGNPTGLSPLPSSYPAPLSAYRTRLDFSLSGDYLKHPASPTLTWDAIGKAWDVPYSWDNPYQ